MRGGDMSSMRTLTHTAPLVWAAGNCTLSLYQWSFVHEQQALALVLKLHSREWGALEQSMFVLTCEAPLTWVANTYTRTWNSTHMSEGARAEGTCAHSQSSTHASGGCLCSCVTLHLHDQRVHARKAPCAQMELHTWAQVRHSSTLHLCEWSFVHEQKSPPLMPVELCMHVLACYSCEQSFPRACLPITCTTRFQTGHSPVVGHD